MRYRMMTALVAVCVAVAALAGPAAADGTVREKPRTAVVGESRGFAARAALEDAQPVVATVGYSRAPCARLTAALQLWGVRYADAVWLTGIAWRETACGQGLTGAGTSLGRGCHRDADDYTCSRWALNFHPRVMGRNAWVRVCGVADAQITALRNLLVDAGCTARVFLDQGRRPWR